MALLCFMQPQGIGSVTVIQAMYLVRVLLVIVTGHGFNNTTSTCTHCQTTIGNAHHTHTQGLIVLLASKSIQKPHQKEEPHVFWFPRIISIFLGWSNFILCTHVEKTWQHLLCLKFDSRWQSVIGMHATWRWSRARVLATMASRSSFFTLQFLALCNHAVQPHRTTKAYFGW